MRKHLNRRSMLAATGALAGVGLGATAGSAQQTISASGGCVSVRDHGAAGDGATDDTNAFRKAIERATDLGTLVYLPNGRFRLTGPLTLSEPCCGMIGCGWSANRGSGAWCFLDHDSDVAITLKVSQGEVRGIAFYQEQTYESDGTPVRKYPPALHCTHGGKVRDVFLLNTYRGIVVSGTSQIDSVYGCPLDQGILVRNAGNTGYINNVHFWSGFHLADDNRLAWRQQHAEAIRVEHADNWLFSNIFANHVSVGIHFCNGRAPRFHISNLEIDGSKYGLLFDDGADRSGGTVINMAYSGHQFDGCRGIRIASPDVYLLATNTYLGHRKSFTNLNGRHCVQVAGSRSRALMHNVSLDMHPEATALKAEDGGRIEIARAGFEINNDRFHPEVHNPLFKGDVSVV